ncbi:hypothetical protein AB1Y20_013029 [Prymnesium parvum]|uniref:Uncharacterized protein n=1 Tax=Prymnesium parvum TaxID=97485 RepID=A0AB34IN50_PRYPA
MALLIGALMAASALHAAPGQMPARVAPRPTFRLGRAPVLSESPFEPAQSEEERLAVNAKLESDVAAFRAQKEADGTLTDSKDREDSLLQMTINTLGKVLTFNFFVICIFFLWFLAGLAAQFGLQQTAVIDSFRGAWDLIILPLLSTHMALTFLSAGLERI